MGHSNTSLRGCLFVTEVNSKLQVLLIRGEGKSRIDCKYWQLHNLSGSFWCGQVCLWSLGVCAFLKGACFPSLLPLCIQLPDFTYGFSYGTASHFDKGERARGTEVPTSFPPSLLPSLILIPDHPQHPLCTHHWVWAGCPRHQARYQSYLCFCRCTSSKGKWCRLIVIPWSTRAFLEYLIL